MSGGIYVPPMTLRSFGDGDGAPAGAGSVPQAPPWCANRPRPAPCRRRRCSPLLGLTPRQTDVLALLLQGKPNN